MGTFAPILLGGMRSRKCDSWGFGHFGAPRTGRFHRGLDIAASPGDHVLSPIQGNITREVTVYSDDSTYRGVVILGAGSFSGYEVRIYYVLGLTCGSVRPGQFIGTVQDLSGRYPGITNHIHLQVGHGGRWLDPIEVYKACF